MHNNGRQPASLLIIAYKFPPMQSVSCNRTWALYNEMRHFFDEVFVISTSNRHKPPLDNINTSGIKITDVRTMDYRTAFQKRNSTAVVSEKTKQSVIGRLALKLQSSFPSLFLFGEGNSYYISGAVKEAEAIVRKYNVSHVFSTFPPYADHIIAHKLKKAHPELTWIADFRDLHIDPAQDNLFRRSYQMKVNQKILWTADVVTTVSEGLAVHLRELHSKVIILPNGIRNEEKRFAEPYPKFTIAYTGSMFQDKRKPDSLLKVINRILKEGLLREEDIQLLYAGKDSAVWQALVEKYGLKSIFVDKNLVSRTEAERIQRMSHINLLLTYSTDTLKGNLTGKLFDYLSARRPLIVLVNGPKDVEIESLISTTGAGIVSYDGDENSIYSFIAEKIREWKLTGRVHPDLNENALKNMQWTVIVNEFMQQLKPPVKSRALNV